MGEKFLHVEHAQALAAVFVTQMLSWDLFAAANLFVYILS